MNIVPDVMLQYGIFLGALFLIAKTIWNAFWRKRTTHFEEKFNERVDSFFEGVLNRYRTEAKVGAANLAEIPGMRLMQALEINRNGNRLYETGRGTTPQRIPAIFDTSDRFAAQVHNLGSDWPFLIASTRIPDFTYDKKFVEKQQRRNRVMDNDRCMYVMRNNDNFGPLKVGITRYFDSIALSQALSSQAASTTSSPLVESGGAFTSFSRAISDPIPGAMILGIDTCAVMQTATSRRFIMHQRSARTVNAEGLWALTPACSVSPNINQTRSQYGLVFYNVLREFLEEVFGMEEARDSETHLHPDPDWIFDNDHARYILKQFKRNRARLFCLGAMVDLTHGSLVLATKLEFDSPKFYSYVLKHGDGNWEMQDRTTHLGDDALDAPDHSAARANLPKLAFPALDTPGIGSLVSCRHTKTTSVFTLDRVLVQESG